MKVFAFRLLQVLIFKRLCFVKPNYTRDLAKIFYNRQDVTFIKNWKSLHFLLIRELAQN
jgi:hypothetical protein